MLGKFFSPEQKEDENKQKIETPEEEAYQGEDKRIEEGNELRRIAEEQMKGDKAERPEDKKE